MKVKSEFSLRLFTSNSWNAPLVGFKCIYCISLFTSHRWSLQSQCWRALTSLRPTCRSSDSSSSTLQLTFCVALVNFGTGGLSQSGLYRTVWSFVQYLSFLKMRLNNQLSFSRTAHLYWCGLAPIKQHPKLHYNTILMIYLNNHNRHFCILLVLGAQ